MKTAIGLGRRRVKSLVRAVFCVENEREARELFIQIRFES